MADRCAECFCLPQDCSRNIPCIICDKQSCCVSSHAIVKRSSLAEFFRHAKKLYTAALGIEILCIASAEIGENVGLYAFGFNPLGIAVAYATGYALAGVATFFTILGRFGNGIECSCCSVLEQGMGKGFAGNLAGTMRDFVRGAKKLWHFRNLHDMRSVLKTSVVILITAESACILTAETVGIVFYQYSLLLSIPLALLAGAFAIVAPVAYRKAKS